MAAGALAVLLVACGDDDASSGQPVPSATEATATAASPTPAPTRPPAASVWTDWPNTDFTQVTIDIDEVIRGCPWRDCIPALDAAGAVTIPSGPGGEAHFAPVAEVDLDPQLPVAVVRAGDEVRGYPLHVLTWHEVVNDVLGGVPVAVTFCPLCNTAISFDRRVEGRTLDFGVSGNLRNSDLIMWDRQTESWWQQATGEAIVGELAGTQLVHLATSIIAFDDFARDFPDALVLTEETGFARSYGVNPYQGYDTSGTRPFLFNGEIDPRLDGLERVVAIERGDDAIAIPFTRLAEAEAISVEVGGEEFVVFWAGGTASALDSSNIASSRDVGAATVFLASAAGMTLSFEPGDEGGTFTDRETGSTWTISGRATHGELAGTQLQEAIHTTQFWFSWAAFYPNTRIWEG